MKRTISSITILAVTTSAFISSPTTKFVAPSFHYSPTKLFASDSDATTYEGSFGLVDNTNREFSQTRISPVNEATKEQKQANAHKNDGMFAPVVKVAKAVLGDEQLNKIRAKAISLHSDVIGSFVDTANTDFGSRILRRLFELADQNRNGKIEEEELKLALQTLGFDWLKDKQVKGIFSRADAEEKGYITLEDWLREAPKTLRTNLIKLAKKNGGDLGFLA